jgi:Carbon dioxide concentrating mechanism/carboxysome shell protein
MRIGEVIGTVTLSRVHRDLIGTQWSIVTPLSLEQLIDGKVATGGAAEEVVLYDELNAGIGEWVAFSEGAEAAMPFHPNVKPVDAYCSAILDTIELDHEAILKMKN